MTLTQLILVQLKCVVHVEEVRQYLVERHVMIQKDQRLIHFNILVTIQSTLHLDYIVESTMTLTLLRVKCVVLAEEELSYNV